MAGLGSTKKSLMDAATSHEKSDNSDLLTNGESYTKITGEVAVNVEKTKPKIAENAENLTWLENGSVEFHGVFRTTRRIGMQCRHHNFLVPFSVDKLVKKILVDSELSMNELANLLFIDLIEKGQLPPKLLKQYKKETANSK